MLGVLHHPPAAYIKQNLHVNHDRKQLGNLNLNASAPIQLKYMHQAPPLVAILALALVPLIRLIKQRKKRYNLTKLQA